MHFQAGFMHTAVGYSSCSSGRLAKLPQHCLCAMHAAPTCLMAASWPPCIAQLQHTAAGTRHRQLWLTTAAAWPAICQQASSYALQG